MLRTNTVDTVLLKLLRGLQSDAIYNNFFLAGGTALALQIGPRKSLYLDLFTENEFDANVIFDNLNAKYKNDFAVINHSKSIYQTLVLGIKLHAVTNRGSEARGFVDVYWTCSLTRLVIEQVLRKALLFAVFNGSCSETEFSEQLYFLLRFFSLKDMFELYKKKYTKDDIIDVKRSLVYFGGIPAASWKSLVMIQEAVSAEVIKNHLVCALNNYKTEIRRQAVE